MSTEQRYVPLTPHEQTTADDSGVQVSDSPVSLDGVIDSTEAGLSARDFSPAELRVECSFDLNTTHGQVKLIEAQNGKHGDLIGAGEFIATITDWACWQKGVIRMDGQIQEMAWVACWWTRERGTISTASLLTVKQWANIARALRSGRLSLPMQFIFVPNASKIKGGNPWYSIVPKVIE